MYAQSTNCQFPIFADPTTKLYDYLGMKRTLAPGSKRPDYIRASMVQTTMQSIVQGVMSGKGMVQGGDFKQVGGELLFEDGKVTWIHRMKNTRDHAEVDELRSMLGLTGSGDERRGHRHGGALRAMTRRMSWSRRQERSMERSKERSRSRSDRVTEEDEDVAELEVKEKEQKKSKRRSFFARAEPKAAEPKADDEKAA